MMTAEKKAARKSTSIALKARQLLLEPANAVPAVAPADLAGAVVAVVDLAAVVAVRDADPAVAAVIADHSKQ